MCVTQQENSNRSALEMVMRSCRKQANKQQGRGGEGTSAEGWAAGAEAGPGVRAGGSERRTKVEGGLGKAEKRVKGRIGVIY